MFKYKYVNLPNGGKLAYTKNKFTKGNLIRIEFDSGSSCDNKMWGLAHFTEHMLFSGTKNLDKQQVIKKYYNFDDVNASTGYRLITFRGTILNDEFTDYLDTALMMINESVFAENLIEEEKKIVNQEITRSSDDNKRKAHLYFSWLLTRKEHYKNNATLGTKESVAKIKSKNVRAFVDKYFIANNLRVFICSPMSYSQVRKYIIKHLESKLKIDNNFEPLPLMDKNYADTNFYEIMTTDIDKNYLTVGFRNPHGFEDREYLIKLDFVLSMVNDISEGIQKILRHERNLVYGANFEYSVIQDEGIVTFDTSLEKQNINPCIQSLFEYINNILKNGFSEELFEKVKRFYKRDKLKSQTTARSRFNLIQDLKFRSKLHPEKYFEKIRENLTLEEANNIFKELFHDKNAFMATYGNAEKKDVMTRKEFDKLYNNNIK